MSKCITATPGLLDKLEMLLVILSVCPLNICPPLSQEDSGAKPLFVFSRQPTIRLYLHRLWAISPSFCTPLFHARPLSYAHSGAAGI